jgi:plasmid stabilization system protein ParE
VAIRVLPEARDDLREAVRYYRDIKPPAVGKNLAARVLSSFKQAMESVGGMPLSRPEHPDIPGVRYAIFEGFPYMAFYTLKGEDVVVVSVEYATSDYVERVAQRVDKAK